MDLDVLRGSESRLDGPVRVAVDAMGGDHAPDEVVIGAVDWARATRTRSSCWSATRRASRRSSDGRSAGQRDASSTPPSRSSMDEHPGGGRPQQARREHQRLHAARARGPGRCGRDGRPYRRRRRLGDPLPGPPARASIARRWPSRWSPTGARWCCSTSAPRPIRPATTSPSTRAWARSLPSRCWA